MGFPTAPSSLGDDAFVAAFGGIYEHSSWVAEGVSEQVARGELDEVDALVAAMAAVVDAAPRQQRMALILAHPDLAGRAAVRGELTAESTGEQASAGIDQCNAEEFARFQRYNEAYKAKFGFPFIMAVRGSNRHKILAAFETRLENDAETEFHTAIEQIHKIARLRLEAVARGEI
jgi:OHCU decarboxylase